MTGTTKAQGRCGFLGVGLVLLLVGPGFGRADDGGDDGLFITVPNPITSDVMNRIKEKTERARRRADRRITRIVYDFNPDNSPSGSSQYGPCRDLAQYLMGLHDIRTIAFVRNEVTRHTVLPVLACQELVMAPDAKLGDVLRDQPGPLGRDEEIFYRQVARHDGRWPIIWKMFNPNLEVLEGRTPDGSIWYVAAGQPPNPGVVVTRRDPVLPVGAVGLYTAAQAQKFGLCKLIKATRQEVAEAYQMSATSLREDPLDGRSPVAWRVEVRGPVNAALRETLERRIRRAIGQGANVLILELHCAGGDTVVARDLAKFLQNLRDDAQNLPVMTIAYVPQRAPDTATFLAFGCTEIVMGPDAVLGDFESVVFRRQGRAPPNPFADGRKERNRPQLVLVPEEEYAAKRESLVALARDQGYSPLLAQGMLDRQLVLYQVESIRGARERRIVTQEELDADRQGERRWGNERLLKRAGEFLTLTSSQAVDLGVARHVAGSAAELYALYGIDASKVRDAGPDWLDELAAFLRHPAVTVILIGVGILCLVLELKMPGFGLPGIISALCFVLFFWAQSQLSGQIVMLAVLLFILGLILIALEVFVVPGFGVTGVSGILFALVGLGLATLEKKPETTQEWLDFGQTIGMFGMGLVAAVLVALFMGRYLPHIPGANRLVLPPPTERPDEAAALPSELPYASLLGAVGTATTPLRPAGMVQFGDQYVDVVAEGSFVAPGARVRVIEVEGNRVVVQEIADAGTHG
ncbi:MAG: hypothetical protein NZ700_00195 [Gemmataceae bacterium]|nr:hypothetical protein [Gemmataceae bacterium]MDW8265132.1 NfeD family protein [Gemmataceae bacterium]